MFQPEVNVYGNNIYIYIDNVGISEHITYGIFMALMRLYHAFMCRYILYECDTMHIIQYLLY